jgi:hypothetical protein
MVAECRSSCRLRSERGDQRIERVGIETGDDLIAVMQLRYDDAPCTSLELVAGFGTLADVTVVELDASRSQVIPDPATFLSSRRSCVGVEGVENDLVHGCS